MKKRILSIVLILCMVLPYVPTTASAAQGITPVTPQKDTGGVYQIGTAEELYGFAQLVNSGAEPSASAVLTADIVVNTGVLKADGNLADDTSGFTSWTPIARKSRYTGKFDGQNHTISGLYFNNTDTDYIGLFGYLGSGGEIKNVGVIDSYFRGKYQVGGVCGYNYRGAITGCYNAGTVSGNNTVGGVCGTNTGAITGCYNTGTVSGLEYVGGVCGYNMEDGTITGCHNTGTVSGTGDEVGGVCEHNEGTITGCYTNRDGDTYYKSNDEFKDGTVCALLNKAIGISYDVTFYQGEEIPVFLSKISYQYCTVNYAVAPTYTVTIPETVTLGQTATIKAENVVVDEDKQLKVTLTGTSETDNAFKVKSAEGAELSYTVNDGTKDISINENILTVNPDNSDSGTAVLTFNVPNGITFAGKYTGTVIFTVSVENV